MLVVCMRNIWGTIWTQSVVKKNKMIVEKKLFDQKN